MTETSTHTKLDIQDIAGNEDQLAAQTPPIPSQNHCKKQPNKGNKPTHQKKEVTLQSHTIRAHTYYINLLNKPLMEPPVHVRDTQDPQNSKKNNLHFITLTASVV
jgi:hypothetical protein